MRKLSFAGTGGEEANGCSWASCQLQVEFELIGIIRINEQLSRWCKMAGNLYIIVTLSGVKQSSTGGGRHKGREEGDKKYGEQAPGNCYLQQSQVNFRPHHEITCSFPKGLQVGHSFASRD